MRLYKVLSGLMAILMLFTSTAYAWSLSELSFQTVYDGLGTAVVDQSTNTADLTPMIATSPAETHAALVVSDIVLANSYEISMTVTNNAQLRQNSAPNPWEAPWIVFGYNDAIDSLGNPDQTFTYLILKPNGYGLELGEALIEDGQNFLWTSTVGVDSYDVGLSYDVTINVNGDIITVTIDGVEKFVFTDASVRTLSLAGKFGFYSEDANVSFSNINVQQLSNAGAVGFNGGVERQSTRHDRYVKRAYYYMETPTTPALKDKIRVRRKEKQKEISKRGELPSLNESALRFKNRQKVKRK